MKMKFIKYFAVLMLLVSQQAYSKNSCTQLFGLIEATQANNYDLIKIDQMNSVYFNTYTDRYQNQNKLRKMLNQESDIYYDAHLYWSHALPKVLPVSLYRGMALKSVDHIIKILENGLKANDSKFKKLYFSHNSALATTYAFEPNNEAAPESIQVVFEFDNTKVKTRYTNYGCGAQITNKEVLPENILRIYLFNKHKDLLQPFDVFTPEEFLNKLNK